ncbi:chorismate mutase [Pseudomonas japonica]|uniref:chorismate mutase n=1 Tax=Pseudomonas japonica TaxID=256466 RepID=UPI0038152EB3
MSGIPFDPASAGLQDLRPCREQLDRINLLLVDLLAERMTICRVIARIKARRGMPVIQPQRVVSTLERVRELSRTRQLRAEYLEDLFQLIIEETCDEELRVITDLQRLGEG